MSVHSRKSNPEANELDVISMYSYNEDSQHPAHHQQYPQHQDPAQAQGQAIYDPNYVQQYQQQHPHQHDVLAYDESTGHYDQQPQFDHHQYYQQQAHHQQQHPEQYFDAASSVLGMGPPSLHGAPPPPGPSYVDPSSSHQHLPPGGLHHPPPPGHGGPPPQQYYPDPSGHHYGPDPGHPGHQYADPAGLQYGPGPGHHYPDPAGHSHSHHLPTGPPHPHQLPPGAHPHQPPADLDDGDPDFSNRPSLGRNTTATSLAPNSIRSKAVDLNAPPFTKEFIDQYRTRIKADPDPEAHYKYARYLIEAAKRVGSEAKDQRAVKKYRDLLIGEALKVMRKLATQGDALDEAQFFLANCYGTGTLGLQVDHERAYHLYLQAAKQNHAAACYRVAVCNEIGAGTRREPPRAAAFYRKAASLGDTAAMYKLGMILLNGTLGEARNPREAIGWLKRAGEQADTENPHALHELGLLFENPTGQIVPFDPVYARNLFTQAAHLGYTQSQFRLGQCFEYGALTCPVDPRRSIAWYTKAAEKGDPEAELALSGWYLTGSEGVLKQSDSEAYLWARRAANKGLAKAEYAVGYYAEVGIGIKQDVEFAKRWYMRAAAQGNKRAMNRLTEMKRMGNKRTPMSRPTRQQAKDECVIV